MAAKVRFHSDAQRDLDQAALWYEKQGRGLGLEFLDAVEKCVLLVADNPAMFQIVVSGVRRGLTKRFPYAVYYRQDGERIIILGVFHSSRSPKVWKRRVRR